MTDAGENLEQRMLDYGILAECQEAALKFVRDELERAAEIAANPYNEADVLRSERPSTVGAKIAAAIRKLKE